MTTSPLEGLIFVAHGPEVFDSGDIAEAMRLMNPSRVFVAGVLARTAAEESGLPVSWAGEPPSRVINNLTKKRVLLLNRGKTPESGKVFGNIVASRLGEKGLIQIEYTARTVYCWDRGDADLARYAGEVLDYPVVFVLSSVDSSRDVRVIRGCIPGEPVFINGIVIGTATRPDVIISLKDGKISPGPGLIPKSHGLEKLAGSVPPDIRALWCKSGTVRSHPPGNGEGRRCAPRGVILVIDHAGSSLYENLGPGVCGIVSIGDDTTAVCGHIGVHLGIPVLGITDGDEDGVVYSAFAPSSLIMRTRGERDDDLGREVAAYVPSGMTEWDGWVRYVRGVFHGRVDIITPPFQ